MSETLALFKQNACQQKRIEGLQEKVNSLVDRRSSGPGFPFGGDSAFGILYVADDMVKIAGGEIQIGDQIPVACDDLEMQLTVDYSKVGIQYDYANMVLTIVNFGASVVYDAAFFRKWLYEFRLVNGEAYYWRNGILNPTLPANYGDTPT